MAAPSGKPGPGQAFPPPKKRPRALVVPNLRLLWITIFVAVLMLSVKVNDVWRGMSGTPVPIIEINQSQAQQPTPPGGRKPGKPSPASLASTAPATPSAPSAPLPEGGDSRASSGEGGEGEPSNFTQNEVEVLQKLAVRRETLDARQKDLDLRENLVKAAEARIDKKIGEMKELQSNIEGMLKQVDRQDEEKLKSLVKIYENMKPKDAANILSTLELPIQLGVLGHMKEAKVAPILSAMDIQQAKTVTDAMAARRAARAEGQPN